MCGIRSSGRRAGFLGAFASVAWAAAELESITERQLPARDVLEVRIVGI